MKKLLLLLLVSNLYGNPNALWHDWLNTGNITAGMEYESVARQPNDWNRAYTLFKLWRGNKITEMEFYNNIPLVVTAEANRNDPEWTKWLVEYMKNVETDIPDLYNEYLSNKNSTTGKQWAKAYNNAIEEKNYIWLAVNAKELVGKKYNSVDAELEAAGAKLRASQPTNLLKTQIDIINKLNGWYDGKLEKTYKLIQNAKDERWFIVTYCVLQPKTAQQFKDLCTNFFMTTSYATNLLVQKQNIFILKNYYRQGFDIVIQNMSKEPVNIGPEGWEQVVKAALVTKQHTVLDEIVTKLNETQQSITTWETMLFTKAKLQFQAGDYKECLDTIYKLERDEVQTIPIVDIQILKLQASIYSNIRCEPVAWDLFILGDNNLDYVAMIRALEPTNEYYSRKFFKKMQQIRLEKARR